MNPEPTIAFLESIGGGEILMIFVVILLMFGPKRLPEMARMLGRTSAQFQKALQEFKDLLMKAENAAEADNLLDSKPPAALPEEYADHPKPGHDATDHPAAPDRSGAPDEPEPPEPPRAG